MKKTLFFLLFGWSALLFSQYMPNYYSVLESNRPKGNKYLYYRLYSTSTTTYPAIATDFDNSFTTAANYRTAGYVALTSNAGNLNSSSSSTTNILNFGNATQLGNAIGSQTPYSGFNGDGFTIVISGYFVPKQTGTYTFSIEGDDAVDLFINNTNVANHYGGHAASPIGTHTGTISLIAGKKYLFRARMQEGAGGEALLLFWKKPSEAAGSVWYQDLEELSGEEVLPNGLVLSVDPGNWYTFPRHGNAVFDLSRNTNGTLSNATHTISNGGLFSFDGDIDYIDFGKSPANFPIGDISIFIWIKASAFRNQWNIFMTKWFDISGTTVPSDFHYAVFQSGGVNYQNLYTTNTNNINGTTPLNINTWYYIGFTLKVGGNLQMYINGDTDGPSRTGVSRTLNTQTNLLVGDHRSGGVVCWNGQIGSFHIYNRELSADEVLQNFNATKHKYGL